MKKEGELMTGKEIADGYCKTIVDKMANHTADEAIALINSVGGYMKSQLKPNLGKTALIQIISNTDSPERELAKVCNLLGISDIGTDKYTWDTMPDLDQK